MVMAILAIISVLDDLLLFLAGLWFFVYLPGRWWSRGLKVSPLDSFLTSLILGLVQFTLLQFFLGLLGVRWLAYALVSSLGLISLVVHGLELSRPTKAWRLPPLTWVLLGAGVAGQSSLVFLSGLRLKDGGLLFTEYRDALWHLSLIEELAVRVPPLHPGLAGVPLTQYHFFTDLFFGSFLAVLPLDRLDLLFRVMPLFLSGLFGLVLVSLARNFLKNDGAWLLFFAYFTGSFAWVLPVVFPGMPWGDSSFWVSQTFAMLINPPFSLSVSLLAFLSVLLAHLAKNWHPQLELAVILLAGPLVAFKVYAGIAAAAGLLGFGLCRLWQRDLRIIRLGLLAALLALAVFLPTNDFGFSTGFLIWAPGWFLRAMVENPDRVYRPGMVLAEATLRFFGSKLGLLRLKLMELGTFLAGNFGVRLLGLAAVRPALGGWGGSVFAFWSMVLLSGVLFPLLFIQRGSVANTIQTFYYSLVAADLFAAMVAGSFLSKRRPWLARALVVVIVAAAVPTSVKMALAAATARPRLVPAAEMTGYRELAKLDRERTVVLVPPTKRHLEAMWVGALADKRVVYADQLMIENTRQPFAERRREVEEFFKERDPGRRQRFLKRFGVTHVVLVGDERKNYSLDNLPLDRIVDNEQILVLAVR
jgi:hypothetical protein